jgi:hypothetical protein
MLPPLRISVGDYKLHADHQRIRVGMEYSAGLIEGIDFELHPSKLRGR